MATIGLMGDVMLGRRVAERLAHVHPHELWSPELIELTAGLDLMVVNLECCISEGGQPTEGVRSKPFFFRAPPAAVSSLQAIGVDAATLANNHALDFGPDALADTLTHLETGGIATVGAGEGPDRARAGTVLEGGELRLGLVAVSDHPREFAAAPDAHGIAYADLRRGAPDWLVAEIRRLKLTCDVVLAFPHWGPNMTVRPAPWQRDLARALLESGADVVAGHSAHVFHGLELVGRHFVAYDLGDALDDYAIDRKLRNDLGLLALWHVDETGASVELVGLHLDYCFTELASGPDAEWIAARLEQACSELHTRIERVGEHRFHLLRPTCS
jgi:poly-gamma-glutamate capsule biosynthesis protein CapA/YwtB (metallophosphatase superfamily)